ncbi:MAG: hypothetical protein ACLU70_15290 [Lachnospira sp.]
MICLICPDEELRTGYLMRLGGYYYASAWSQMSREELEKEYDGIEVDMDE